MHGCVKCILPDFFRRAKAYQMSNIPGREQRLSVSFSCLPVATPLFTCMSAERPPKRGTNLFRILQAAKFFSIGHRTDCLRAIVLARQPA
jgi:hypothetical protein